MKRILITFFTCSVLLLSLLSARVLAQSTGTALDQATPSNASPQTTGEAGTANLRNLNCAQNDGSSFLGFPTWYKYINTTDEQGCPNIEGVEGIWAIVIAVIEFMLRLAVYISIGLVIWGGVKMIMSQGEPEGISNARKILQNSLIGLGITIVATAVVAFIGSQFRG